MSASGEPALIPTLGGSPAITPKRRDTSEIGIVQRSGAPVAGCAPETDMDGDSVPRSVGQGSGQPHKRFLLADQPIAPPSLWQ